MNKHKLKLFRINLEYCLAVLAADVVDAVEIAQNNIDEIIESIIINPVLIESDTEHIFDNIYPYTYHDVNLEPPRS